MSQHLDGTMFVQMVMAGHRNLETNKDTVNALNVFPVPDGDTGTNMSLSMTSGVSELRKYINEPLYRATEAVSTGLLMGARGNSGVILSQLFRGFSKAVTKQTSVDAVKFADALQNGVTTAYSAVVKPVEGTILTVAKDAAKAAQAAAKLPQATIVSVMEATLKEAEASLKRTPDMLPVLKQAGVVDSGGQGLVCIYRGWLAGMTGVEVTEALEVTAPAKEKVMTPAASYSHGDGDSEYGYCTEFIIRLEKAAADEQAMEKSVRDALMELGDSMLVVAADELVKVHIHALQPGNVLNAAMGFGALTRIKIDNMTEQNHNLRLMDSEEAAEAAAEQAAPLTEESTSNKPYGIVTVTTGTGLVDVFKSLGVEGIIEGGQTMNPSTEDIVNAVKQLHADRVFILPNNSNIIMAAEQAKSVLGDVVTVIPTKSIPQGIAAALSFDANAAAESNESAMKSAVSRVKSGSITQAVRDSVYQDLEIKENDFMGMLEGKVVALGKELDLTGIALLEKMVDEESEVVTVFYGDQISESEAQELIEAAQAQFDHCEFELHEGGQPLYSYIFSVE
ncbi:DAK2 domain-containing protein [Tumebacillus sp. ITR2]|uniref:DAK2 domain-containing protein n=1 Tax=Tumebacillus amylolyticus TaxID=2801339 RepID=A0ABS1JEW5_9BACL|nr:DAK2 domain-containing protein [Tumebacillus amylolyticus]MBL0388837.1 DAK2 domain-containing protein [Tumebacillus amylolyticus]